jgi:hypothetical protein
MLLYYEKPVYYTIIHILIGVVSYYINILGMIYIIYQFTQLYLNKRFFLFQWKIEDGNTIFHTFIKLGEFMIGWLFAYYTNDFIADRFISLP